MFCCWGWFVDVWVWCSLGGDGDWDNLVNMCGFFLKFVYIISDYLCVDFYWDWDEFVFCEVF